MTSPASVSLVVPLIQRQTNEAQRRQRDNQLLSTNKLPQHLDKYKTLIPLSNHSQYQQDSPPSYTIYKKISGSVRLVYENTNDLTP